MRYRAQDLFNKNETANMMHYLVRKYYNDLRSFRIRRGGKSIPLINLTIKQFFDLVRRIPYRQDKKPIEVVSRPVHILKLSRLGMDCKKKSVLIASYLKSRKIPYRFIGSSIRKNKKIHHIFPQAYLDGDWVNLDATYNHYKPGQPKKVTYYESL